MSLIDVPKLFDIMLSGEFNRLTRSYNKTKNTRIDDG